LFGPSAGGDGILRGANVLLQSDFLWEKTMIRPFLILAILVLAFVETSASAGVVTVVFDDLSDNRPADVTVSQFDASRVLMDRTNAEKIKVTLKGFLQIAAGTSSVFSFLIIERDVREISDLVQFITNAGSDDLVLLFNSNDGLSFPTTGVYSRDLEMTQIQGGNDIPLPGRLPALEGSNIFGHPSISNADVFRVVVNSDVELTPEPGSLTVFGGLGALGMFAYGFMRRKHKSRITTRSRHDGIMPRD
jgi:hypothetical protein